MMTYMVLVTLEESWASRLQYSLPHCFLDSQPPVCYKLRALLGFAKPQKNQRRLNPNTQNTTSPKNKNSQKNATQKKLLTKSKHTKTNTQNKTKQKLPKTKHKRILN